MTTRRYGPELAPLIPVLPVEADWSDMPAGLYTHGGGSCVGFIETAALNVPALLAFRLC